MTPYEVEAMERKWSIMEELKGKGKGIGFERIRRITGYLTGTIDRWNDAKRAELNDRVTHGMKSPKE